MFSPSDCDRTAVTIIRTDSTTTETTTKTTTKTTTIIYSSWRRKQNKIWRINDSLSLKRSRLKAVFWSYCGFIVTSLDDDSVIEAALVHLNIEDFPLLLEIWDIVHIKRVWKDRLVSQGKRMNIRNYSLAERFFGIQNPEEYLKRNAKFHKWCLWLFPF